MAARGVIYVRVSTEAQSEKGSSLESQEDACRQYCKDHNIVVTGVYSDVFSGAKLWERPGLTQLRDMVKARSIDVMVVYALDRLSREQHHQGMIFSETERYGVKLASVTEDLDNSPLEAVPKHESASQARLRGVLASAPSSFGGAPAFATPLAMACSSAAQCLPAR
jgi:predicted site-specific integrase-resolvase